MKNEELASNELYAAYDRKLNTFIRYIKSKTDIHLVSRPLEASLFKDKKELERYIRAKHVRWYAKDVFNPKLRSYSINIEIVKVVINSFKVIYPS